MDNSNVWNDIFQNQEWGQYPAESLLRFGSQFMRGRTKKVLEIGCGIGTNIRYFQDKGYRCVGIDFSAAAIEIANTRLNNNINECEMYCADITKLDWSKFAFDTFVDNECAYTLPYNAAAEVYFEAYKRLPETGLMYVKTFAEDCWGNNTGMELDDNYFICDDGPLANKGPSRFTTLDSLRDMFHFASSVEINKYAYTVNHGQNLISEYVVIAEKKDGQNNR